MKSDNKIFYITTNLMSVCFSTDFVCFQIARLRSELDIVRGNIKVMSEMLTEMVPGQENASDLELLQVRLIFLCGHFYELS